jgi:hypothetical protein
MSDINKVFRLAFSIILFCTGVWLLIYHSEIYKDTLKSVREGYVDKEIYQQYNGLNREIVSGAELIATLCNVSEYNIKIDEMAIPKGTFDPNNIKNYKIRDISYRKTYLYDENGDIKAILYTGLTG